MPLRVPLPLSAAWEEIWATAAERVGVVGEAHLFLGILDAENEMVAALLMLSGVSREEARLYAQSWLDNGPATVERKLEFSRSTSRVLLSASREAERDQSRFIEPHHFFIACASHRRGAHLGEVLRPLGLDAARMRGHLRQIRASQKPYPRGHPLNHLREDTKRAIEAAHAEVRASYCGRIAAAHLLLGLLSDAKVVDRLDQAGCDVEDLRFRARASIRSDGDIATHEKRYSPGAKRALERAARAAKAAGHRHIDCGYLLLGLLPARQTLGEGWRARGRELDSVDGLWTAEQVATLRGTLGNGGKSPHPLFTKLVASEAQLKLLRFAFPISVFYGVICFLLLPILKTAVWPGLLFVGPLAFSGLAMIVTGLFSRKFSRRTKVAWAQIFFGLVAAFFLGSAITDALGFM